MNPEDFKASGAGRVVKTPAKYWAFIPNPLPPKLDYDSDLVALLSEADRKLGLLSGVGKHLPNPYLLIGPFLRIEAVLSSRIEGTEATLSDVYFDEATSRVSGVNSDVKEVRNYIRAMEAGLEGIKELPICGRLIRDIHEILTQGVRGCEVYPGEFRTTQNWIGSPGCLLKDATYVPPPVAEMKDAISDWEKYMNDVSDESPLIKCALMHYQFEAIHPFIDGNGRIGRLLIALFLCSRGYLSQPLLYLSAFFERHRNEYYSHLLSVSREGRWREWIEFFLRAIITQADHATDLSDKLIKLRLDYLEKLEGSRLPKNTIRAMEELFLNPVVSISELSHHWNVSYPTVKTAVSKLVEVGILQESQKSVRPKKYVAPDIFEVLEEA